MALVSLTQETAWVIDDDPVRPELSYAFRTSEDRRGYVLLNDFTGNVEAVCCTAMCSSVPITVKELSNFSTKENTRNIAVFYTLWSYARGAGRQILFDTYHDIKKHRPSVDRFVTLSPKTDMAEKFHTSNGAVVLSRNEESDNYEYVERKGLFSRKEKMH